MPVKPARLCRNPHCPNLTRDPSGYCDLHRPATPQIIPGISRNHKGSPSSRGYDREWRKIREEVLTRAGIPRKQWRFYDVDHNPPYDPRREPDHRKYTLVPRLHGEHSSKTNKYDGGFGNRRGEAFSSQSKMYTARGYPNVNGRQF